MTQADLLPGALAMVDIPGPTLDPETADFLRRYGVRSVCLFGKNIQSETQLRALCRDLRDLMGEHALIALDHEGAPFCVRTSGPLHPRPWRWERQTIRT
ncbi:hypothetical protein ACFSC4_02905 [Deinococcus malanensis]|uniref:hypothetical protein n=1 Tax=Deinococcus malanensis TaxID=1706855 RepID=UPI00363322A2